MDKTSTYNEMAYAITERPRCFFVGGKPFFIYPATLGMIQVCNPILQSLSIDNELAESNTTLEMLRICNDPEDRRKVSILISYRTCRTKEEIYNQPRIEKRADYIARHMSDGDMCSVLIYVLDELRCDVTELETNLGIYEERRWMRQAIASKDNNTSSLTFNGKSIYGSFIGHFCKEYGWSFQYVVWGISYVNLKLLCDDEITTVYMSEDELKRSGVPTDRSAAMMDYKDVVEKYAHEFDNC